MPKPKKHPSLELRVKLKAAGWIKKHKGLYWQSPYNQYFFSPPGAVAVEEKKNPTNA